MGAFKLIIDGFTAIREWFTHFNYNGIPMLTITLYVFIGACICRFILPLFIPQMSWRDRGSDSVRARNK